MSRKKKLSQPKDEISWRDRMHFISLSFEEEAEISQWFETSNVTPLGCLEELLDSQWAIKITPPGKGDDYYFSATNKREGDELADHTFTVKFPDNLDGLIILYYVLTSWLNDGRLQIDAQKSSVNFLRP